MSKEVLLQQRQRQRQVNPLQNENDTEDKEEKMIQDNMEQEIECPRCCEMMALSSDLICSIVAILTGNNLILLRGLKILLSLYI
jgi:hypothetical protein